MVSPPGVVQVLGSTSSAVLLAQDERGHAVALLGEKDAKGNPLSITGAAFVNGARFFSVSLDEAGRPVEIATETGIVRLTEYTEAGVVLESLDAAGQLQRESVALSPEELASLRVPLPLDGSIAKGLDTPPTLRELADFVTQVGSQYGCFAKPAVDAVTGAPRLLDKVSSLLGIVSGCTSLLSPADADYRLLLQRIATSTAVAGCVTGIQITAGTAVTPVGILSAAGAVFSCAAAADAVIKLVGEELLQQRLRIGFVARCDGDLVQGQEGEVRIWLEPRPADDRLTSVQADLQPLGGPLLNLTRGTRWEGAARVKPREAGATAVPVLVAGARSPVRALCGVQATDAPSVTIRTSRAVVEPGAPVEIRAEVLGGAQPLRYQWGRLGHTEVRPPLVGDGSSFVDRITQRTRYDLRVYEGFPLLRSADATPVWVEVCGDGFCSPREDGAICSSDCRDATDGGVDAGRADTGGTADASAADAAAPNAAMPQLDLTFVSCAEACGFRTDVLGCAAGPGCTAFCQAIHNVAAQEGSCMGPATALEDCRYSRSALRLGCTATDARIDREVCGPQAAALRTCKQRRDAPR